MVCMRRKGSWRPRLLLALLGAGSALVLVELVLWASTPERLPPFGSLHRPSEIPGLEYELAPSAAVFVPEWDLTVHTNALGLRGPEVEREKPPGRVRIAAVGDSFTFGQGVGDEETFPRYLEDLLRSSHPGADVEVLNFGVAGYATRDEALVIRHRVLAFGPDLILLGYLPNDPEAHPGHPLHRAFHAPALHERSRLVQLVERTLRQRALRRYPTLAHYLHAPGEGPWETVVEGFRDIRESTTAAGVPVLLFLFPSLRDGPLAAERLRELDAQVEREARANSFELLDLTARFLAEGIEARGVRQSGGSHPDAGGNRLFARWIAEGLEGRYPALFAP
jgi:lysophospholipase L1-like esterase